MEVEKPSSKKLEAPVVPEALPKMLELKNNDVAWICEFCDHQNKIRIEKEEIPTL